MIGINSLAFNVFLQFGHWDLGDTILSPTGMRHMHTFKNEPITVPITKAQVVKAMVHHSFFLWFCFYNKKNPTPYKCRVFLIAYYPF